MKGDVLPDGGGKKGEEAAPPGGKKKTMNRTSGMGVGETKKK